MLGKHGNRFPLLAGCKIVFFLIYHLMTKTMFYPLSCFFRGFCSHSRTWILSITGVKGDKVNATPLHVHHPCCNENEQTSERAEFDFRSTILLKAAIREVRLQPDIWIPASAGTKETWGETNQHQLRWCFLTENRSCSRAPWDKVFVTQEVVYSLELGLTYLFFAGWLDHVKWGDSEKLSRRMHNLLKIHSPRPACRSLHYIALGAGSQWRHLCAWPILRYLRRLASENIFFPSHLKYKLSSTHSWKCFSLLVPSPARHPLQDFSFSMMQQHFVLGG